MAFHSRIFAQKCVGRLFEPPRRVRKSRMLGQMLNKGLITQEEFDKLDPDVTLKGPAKLFLKTKVSMPAETIEQDEELTP